GLRENKAMKFFSQKGLSLVEILIVIGIGAAVAGGVSTLIVNSAKKDLQVVELPRTVDPVINLDEKQHSEEHTEVDLPQVACHTLGGQLKDGKCIPDPVNFPDGTLTLIMKK